MENHAAWMDTIGQPFRVRPADVRRPGPGEVLVRNFAVAVNPIDWKMRDWGTFVKEFPAILGQDAAGEVVELGEGVHRFDKGDRVTGKTFGPVTGETTKSGFQLYSLYDAAAMSHIPDNISYPAAAVLPTCFETAVVALCDQPPKGLGLPMPSLKPSPSGKIIVIWGGSSAVGLQSIHVAVAAGHNVITTASPHNFELCRTSGAKAVFDHRSESVVEDIVAAVKSIDGAFAGLLDTISTPATLPSAYAIAHLLGGGTVAVTMPLDDSVQVPATVKAQFVFGTGPIVHPLWADFVRPALEKGIIKCLPEPLVVGKGLEAVNEGLNASKNGVSAKKVVIEL